MLLSLAGRSRLLTLKLEGLSPTGSIKFRTARHLVMDLERRGLLHSGVTLLESTSGNLGLAVASVALERGLRFRAVVDPKLPTAIRERMREAGAELDFVGQRDETGGYLLTRLTRVAELMARSRAFVWLNQYENPANPAAHYAETAPELWGQTGGQLDAVFVAVSTGGTLAGIGRYLREVAPRVRVVGVDVLGSVVFSDVARPRLLNGIGSSRKSTFIEPWMYDDHVLVSDAEACACCRWLESAAGIAVGGSSGAVLAACLHYLREHPEIERAACICPDGGERYADTIYDDGWLQAKGISVHAPADGRLTRISAHHGLEAAWS